MSKLNVIYTPKIDEEEKRIFEEVFGKNKVIFKEYKFKGITWGAFDIQIIIDTLNDSTTTALLHGTEFVVLITKLVKKLFNRNTKKIMDNKSRPRYTTLVIRKKTNFIVISNANPDNKIFISKIIDNFKKIKKPAKSHNGEYTDKKLKDYLK